MDTPTKRRTANAKADDGLGRGMEFAIVVFAFLGLGYALDRWLGTKPLFMVVLVVVSLIGQFASMWYGYDARMTELEAERSANRTGQRHAGTTSTAEVPAP